MFEGLDVGYCKPVWINSVRVPDYTKLQKNWDGYGAEPISSMVMDVARHMSLVPGGDGSVQFEIHAGGCDIEINISKEGQIEFVSSNCALTEIDSPKTHTE